MPRVLLMLVVAVLLAGCGTDVAPTATPVVVVTATPDAAAAAGYLARAAVARTAIAAIPPTDTASPPTQTPAPPTETPHASDTPPPPTPTGVAGVLRLGQRAGLVSVESVPAQTVVSFRAVGFDTKGQVENARTTVWLMLGELAAVPDVRVPVVEFVALMDLIDAHGHKLPDQPVIRLWYKAADVWGTEWKNLRAQHVQDLAYKVFIDPVVQDANCDNCWSTP